MSEKKWGKEWRCWPKKPKHFHCHMKSDQYHLIWSAERFVSMWTLETRNFHKLVGNPFSVHRETETVGSATPSPTCQSSPQSFLKNSHPVISRSFLGYVLPSWSVGPYYLSHQAQPSVLPSIGTGLAFRKARRIVLLSCIRHRITALTLWWGDNLPESESSVAFSAWPNRRW